MMSGRSLTLLKVKENLAKQFALLDPVHLQRDVHLAVEELRKMAFAASQQG